jgi:alpha-amylase/alpha-mannosidase (GH57 family)
MKYIFIFHANLNYAYLTPDRYEFVIRNAYEMTIDTFASRFPDVQYVFEASGYTIEQMAEKTPDVLEKLKSAINIGQCEFMGSPYAHPMLPNFPKKDGLWSILFSNQVYAKYLGFQPKSFWNPECGWRHYVAEQVAESGYRSLIGDFEAYSRSCGPDGKPMRPEIYEKEFNDSPAFYNFGFNYDLPGDEKTIHFPFNQVAGLPENELRMFLRTDRIAQFGVRYFMGMEGYSLEQYLELIEKYSKQSDQEPEGALIVFADDAEYIGTNGWFKLKYCNDPDKVFEATPDAQDKLIRLVEGCRARGGFTTFDQACQKLPALNERIYFDEDSAWHGGRASTWANTPMAKLLRPWQNLVRKKLSQKTLTNELSQAEIVLTWRHLTNSYNSDGQWPPTLPEEPHIIHPFNYQYCFENLLTADLLVGVVDKEKLTADPVQTLEDILSLQQNLVLQKAQRMSLAKDLATREKAAMAKTLIRCSKDVSALRDDNPRVLQPAEYQVRADALVQARRLVNTFEIEKSKIQIQSIDADRSHKNVIKSEV